MKISSTRNTAALFATLLSTSICNAGVLLKTGFEATESPAYVVGPLVPQNGWFVQIGTPNATIQTSTVFAGTQAVQINASGLPPQNIVRHSLTDPLAEKVVVYDVRFLQSAAGTASSWAVVSSFGNSNFLGEILVDGTNATFVGVSATSGSVPVSRGVWHDYQLIVNFGLGTVNALVDGVLIGSGTTGTSTSVVLIDLGLNGSPGTDSGFFDNVSVINQAPTISKSFSPSTVILNGNSALTITITNPSVTAPETNVGFTDALPAGIALGAGAGFGGCGSPNAGASGNVISMSGATIAPGGTCTFQVFVIGTLAGAWVNTTGTVTSDQGNGISASATLNVQGPPTLSKAFADPVIYYMVDSSNTTTLTFTVSNPAPNPVPLTGIAFTDTLPAGLFVSNPNVSNTCGGVVTATAGSGSIALSGAALAVGASCTLSVQVVGWAVGPLVNTTSNITADGGLVGSPASATVFSSDMYLLWFFSN